MPRSLRIVCIFAFFLLALIGVSEIKDAYPLREFISGSVEHLLVVVTAVLVGAILLWIIEEAVEHHIAPAIRGGLETLAGGIKEEVGKFPSSWEGWPQIMKANLNSMDSPEARSLASAGLTQQAAEKARSLDDKIKVLVQSTDPSDWNKAIGMVDSTQTPPFSPVLTLAYLSWQSGKIDEAIRLGEVALKRATETSAEDLWKAHNSLAYYYAETAKPEFEKKAREYAVSARKAAPSRPEPIDTESFVRITYGKTEEEIMEGVALAEKAKLAGAPFETFVKHMNRAQQRIKTLPERPLDSAA